MVVINRGNMNKPQLNSTWRSQKKETNHEVINSSQAIEPSLEHPGIKKKHIYKKTDKIDKSNILKTKRDAKTKDTVTRLKSTRISKKLSLSTTVKIDKKASKLKAKKIDNNSIKLSKTKGRPRKDIRNHLRKDNRGRPRKHPLPDRS